MRPTIIAFGATGMLVWGHPLPRRVRGRSLSRTFRMVRGNVSHAASGRSSRTSIEMQSRQAAVVRRASCAGWITKCNVTGRTRKRTVAGCGSPGRRTSNKRVLVRRGITSRTAKRASTLRCRTPIGVGRQHMRHRAMRESRASLFADWMATSAATAVSRWSSRASRRAEGPAVRPPSSMYCL